MPLEEGIVGRSALIREAFHQAIGKSQNVFDGVGSDSFRESLKEVATYVPDTSRVREPEFSKRFPKGKLVRSPVHFNNKGKEEKMNGVG